MKTCLVEDVCGDFGYRVSWRYNQTWADFSCYRISARSDNKPLFDRKAATSWPDATEHIDEAEICIDGFVKWDGCCEFNKERMHFCEQTEVDTYCKLIKYIYARAQQLMESHEDKP